MSKKSKEPRETLRLMRWAQDGFPPIDLNNETSVMELIKAFKIQRAVLKESLDVITNLELNPFYHPNKTKEVSDSIKAILNNEVVTPNKKKNILGIDNQTKYPV